MDKIDELKALLDEAEKDGEKFYNKNVKAAGTRVRKKMLDIKNKAHEIRKEIADKNKDD